MVYGTAGKYTFWVKSGATERELTDYLFPHRITKRLNQVSIAEIKLLGVPEDDQDVLVEGATFKLLSQDNSEGAEILVLKGIIDSIEKSSMYEWKITGYGVEIKLQNKITGQSDFRYSTPTATSTIVTNLASTTGLTVNINDNYGSIQIKFENENRLKALDKLAKSCVNATYNTVYNWYSSQGSSPYDTDYINFNDFQGSTTSTYTFDYGGADSDLNAISKKVDKEHLVNAVTILGFGDGTNQLISTTEDAGSIAIYGRQEKAFNEPTVNVQAQLDRLANSYLKRFKDPITTIYIKPSHPKLVLTSVSLGDKVTLNSDSSGTLSGLPLDYRVVGMIIGTNEYGIEDLTLELSNQEIAFLDSISLSSDVIFESYQSATVNDPGHDHFGTSAIGMSGSVTSGASITDVTGTITSGASITDVTGIVTDAVSITAVTGSIGAAWKGATIGSQSTSANPCAVGVWTILCSIAGTNSGAEVFMDFCVSGSSGGPEDIQINIIRGSTNFYESYHDGFRDESAVRIGGIYGGTDTTSPWLLRVYPFTAGLDLDGYLNIYKIGHIHPDTFDTSDATHPHSDNFGTSDDAHPHSDSFGTSDDSHPHANTLSATDAGHTTDSKKTGLTG